LEQQRVNSRKRDTLLSKVVLQIFSIVKEGTTVSIAQCMYTLLVGKSSQHHDPVEVQELSRILI